MSFVFPPNQNPDIEFPAANHLADATRIDGHRIRTNDEHWYNMDDYETCMRVLMLFKAVR